MKIFEVVTDVLHLETVNDIGKKRGVKGSWQGPENKAGRQTVRLPAWGMFIRKEE